MKRDNVLRILAIGFALVILFLAAASFLAFRRARSIQLTSAELVRNHLLTGRLVDDLQQQQERLGSILFRITRQNGNHGEELLREINDVEAAVKRIAASANPSTLSQTWRRLVSVAAAFSAGARGSLTQSPVAGLDLDSLTQLQESFVQLAGQIVKEDAAQSVAVEERIQEQSRAILVESLWLLGGSLVLALACAIITVRTTNDSFRQMEWQAAELNKVSWHMLEGQEAAARRFSHEMHDELGQSLTGLKAMLSGIRPEDFSLRRTECLRLLDEAIGNVRELSQLLRPVILDDFGLDAGLRWLCERFMNHTRIQVDYICDSQGRLSDELETHFFRIAQEALTNIARHSGATSVRVRLSSNPSEVRLKVEDNGKGMAAIAPRKAPSLGMVGMRARARQTGGELIVKSSPLGGVMIEAWAPSRSASHDAEQENQITAS